MARIQFIEGPLRGRAFDLPGGGLTLGSGRGSDVVIEDGRVAERHARVERVGGRWLVSDLHSPAGIFVNGRRRDEAPLHEGTVVALGDSGFEFTDRADAPPAPPPPRARAEPGIENDREAVDELHRTYGDMQQQLARVVVGQRQVIEQVLIAIFCRGHALLVGVPGLAKTLLVSTLAQVLDLRFRRIQFTPDLMPADITGTDVLEDDPETGGRRFRFMHGPLFTNLLLADEINRTPPKTQSALLEAMQERSVTVGEQTWPLPPPFFVLATQNPIEQEGTYPLPEAQLDRFLFHITVDYPEADEEEAIIRQVTGAGAVQLAPMLHGDDIVRLQDVVRRVPAADHVVRFASQLARASRPDRDDAPDFVREMVAWGAGPRAGINLVLAAKARAVLQGRYHATTDDVRAVALPVLRHRVLTTFHADNTGVKSDDIVRQLLDHLTAPAELDV